jgi:hypothetical protein
MSELALSELLSKWEHELAADRDWPAEELCHDRPDLVPELQRRIDALRHLNQLAEQSLSYFPNRWSRERLKRVEEFAPATS